MASGDFEDFLNNKDMTKDSLESVSLLLYFLVFFVMVLLSQMILITAMTISDVGVSDECLNLFSTCSQPVLNLFLTCSFLVLNLFLFVNVTLPILLLLIRI